MIQSPGILFTLFAFVLVIGPLIFFHELGHYFIGRIFGVHAETFSIGFGHELVGWTDRRGTRWKIGWLPLGGYVRFAGDMNPASQPSEDWLMLPPEERARTFQAKPMWQRFCIVAAGPITNFLLAILILAVFFCIHGQPRTPPVIASVQPGSAAQAAGLLPGDRVTTVDRRGISRFEDIATIIQIHPDETIPMEVYRGDRPIHLKVRPKRVVFKDRFGNEADMGLLGVGAGAQVVVPVSVVQALPVAVDQTGAILVTMVQTLDQIVTGRRAVSELGGPVKIAKFAGEQLTDGWTSFVLFMAMISINLGFINLLPIPLLDGGHLFFYVLEGIRRRPLRPKTQEWAFRIGLAILLPFILFVTFNDFGLWHRLAGLIG